MQASVLNHELIDRFSKECLDIFHLKSFVFNQIVSCDIPKICYLSSVAYAKQKQKYVRNLIK